MTEAPIMRNDLSFDFLKEICTPSQSWQILETLKQNYERKIERAGDENDLLKRDIR